jgi:hypothetical protein
MFLGCQAWEWTNLIAKEHMSITTNPFGTHTVDGVYLNDDGSVAKNEEGKEDSFKAGTTYLIHKVDGEWHKRKFKIESGEYKGQIAQESFTKSIWWFVFLYNRISWFPRIFRSRIFDNNHVECIEWTVC